MRDFVDFAGPYFNGWPFSQQVIDSFAEVAQYTDYPTFLWIDEKLALKLFWRLRWIRVTRIPNDIGGTIPPNDEAKPLLITPTAGNVITAITALGDGPNPPTLVPDENGFDVNSNYIKRELSLPKAQGGVSVHSTWSYVDDEWVPNFDDFDEGISMAVGEYRLGSDMSKVSLELWGARDRAGGGILWSLGLYDGECATQGAPEGFTPAAYDTFIQVTLFGTAINLGVTLLNGSPAITVDSFEYWPYAKRDSSGPVYDSTTGAPIT